MDLDRVGIYGTSAGGQNALGALLFHPDFYKVAVADCGCHDNRMDKIWWNEQWMGWPVGPQYAAQSNVTNAHKLQGKLLLIVGEMDHNVDPASTMQVVNALIKADKDFDLLVVPGADHGAREPTASAGGRTSSSATCWASSRGTGPERGEAKASAATTRDHRHFWFPRSAWERAASPLGGAGCAKQNLDSFFPRRGASRQCVPTPSVGTST